MKIRSSARARAFLSSNSLSARLLAFACFMAAGQWVSAGIDGSKHDLGGVGSDNGEICVYCHTPHGSDTSAIVPLWNRNLNTGTSYTRYSTLNTSTLDGSEAPIGSISLACLSCHDGTQARDVVLNAPGSGNYSAAGTYDMGGGLGAISGTPIPNLGTDLTNDHPISIQYAGGGCDSTDGTGTDVCTSVDFTDKDFQSISSGTINSNQYWWVDVTGGIAGTREKTDLQLYSRTDVSGNATLQPTVECGSCHDPHEDAARPVSFMRISNANSAVCLACHAK